MLKLLKLKLRLEQNVKLNFKESKKLNWPLIKKEERYLFKQKLLNKQPLLLLLQILYYQKIKSGVKCHKQKKN
jgi:hypothetical protein